MKIVLLEDLGVPAGRIEKEKEALRQKGHELICYPKSQDPQTIAKEIGDANAIILANMPLPPQSLDPAENLEYIDVAFTGVDHIPLELCKEKGISVSNASGYSDDAVAELVIADAILLERKLMQLYKRGENGEAKTGIRGHLVKGKTVGIIGAGHIGKQTARLFKALGARVIGYNRSEITDPAFDEQLSLDQLLRQSDLVSLHVPLTDKTRKMIGKEQFSLMKPSAFLINAARGPVVDTDALIEALENGIIAGAAVDVYDSEPPLGKDHPILKAPNCLLTPHIGFDSVESMEKRADIVFENLNAWLEGRIQNRVL